MDKKAKALERRVAKSSVNSLGKAEKAARKESNKRKHQENLARRERRLEAQAILRENLDKDPVDISQRFASSGHADNLKGEQGNGRAAPAGGLAVGLQSMADVVASKLAAETREAEEAAAREELANVKAAQEQKDQLLANVLKEEQARVKKKKKAKLARNAAAKLSFVDDEDEE